MFDHITIGVSNLARATAFYRAALAPLGVRQLEELTEDGVALAAFGVSDPTFWIAEERPVTGLLHLAFTAKSQTEVDAFYAAALKAGGRDNGAPGLRPHYHDGYYGAFVLDPDGHNIEAVLHGQS